MNFVRGNCRSFVRCFVDWVSDRSLAEILFFVVVVLSIGSVSSSFVFSFSVVLLIAFVVLCFVGRFVDSIFKLLYRC